VIKILIPHDLHILLDQRLKSVPHFELAQPELISTFFLPDQETRSILIDDIKGTAHDAYGGYPNAVFIINRNGCIVYRSDWNNVSATKKALNRLLSGKPANSKSYFLPVKPTIALKTLKRSGQGAIKDFLLGLPTLIWKNVIKRNVLLFFNLTKTVSPDKRC